MSERWRVKLPADVPDDFDVFVNGVHQQYGEDYELSGRTLLFRRRLVKAERLGPWRWMIGAFGVGTYRQDDSVRRALHRQRPAPARAGARHQAPAGLRPMRTGRLIPPPG